MKTGMQAKCGKGKGNGRRNRLACYETERAKRKNVKWEKEEEKGRQSDGGEREMYKIYIRWNVVRCVFGTETKLYDLNCVFF